MSLTALDRLYFFYLIIIALVAAGLVGVQIFLLNQVIAAEKKEHQSKNPNELTLSELEYKRSVISKCIWITLLAALVAILITGYLIF